MITDLKPYAECKESGLPWLGQVPGHWEVSPLASLARLKSVINQSERQLLSVYLQRGVVRFSDIDEKRTNTTSEDLSKYQAVDRGDFVLNNQQAWRGSVGVSEHSGIVSPAYLVLALSDLYTARYANLLFRDQSLVSQYLVCSKGVGTIQRNLYWPHLKRVGVVVPPPSEQAAIVRFLDWANGRLERAIRAKRKVIALLNEQKQAIIHRAVTRGLDHSAPLKHSGVSWLGEIPAHWEVRRLTSLASFRSGKAHESFVAPDGRYICVTARFVSTGGTAIKRCTECACAAAPGDVLMVMSDLPNGRALARAYLIRDSREYAVNQRVCALTPRGVEPRFLAYFANRNWHLLRHDDGLNQTHLSNYDFKTMPVLVPCAAEQTEIADFLDKRCGFADSTSGRLEREIELLREYRTRLIADVVTGKLDVRTAAARLPDVSVIEPSESDAELDDEPEAEEAAV